MPPGSYHGQGLGIGPCPRLSNCKPLLLQKSSFGRFKYMTEKQQKEHKRKQQEVKGIKISPRIQDHDISFNLKKAIDFLKRRAQGQNNLSVQI